MADTKLIDLPALTTPSSDDLLYIVDDPAGTPVSKQITYANLTAGLGGGGGSSDTFVVKPSDQTVTSSTALINDTHLLVAVGASQTWIVEFYLFMTGNAAGDSKIAINVPAGATGVFGMHSVFGPDTTVLVTGNLNAGATATLTDASAFGLGTSSATQLLMNHFVAVVTTAGTAGTVQLRWAQLVSNAVATTMKAGSFLRAHQM